MCGLRPRARYTPFSLSLARVGYRSDWYGGARATRGGNEEKLNRANARGERYARVIMGKNRMERVNG